MTSVDSSMPSHGSWWASRNKNCAGTNTRWKTIRTRWTCPTAAARRSANQLPNDSAAASAYPSVAAV
nr:hypothetical protein [Micromonospora citrea]